MLELTTLLAAAAIVFGLTRATALPAVPLLILAGVVLGFFNTIPDEDFVLGILEVGLIFLVFSSGLEMSPRRVGKQSGLALTVGMVQFGAMGLVSGWLVLRSGYGIEEALYVAMALSASSTLVVVRLLKSRQELFESFGRMIIGVLLFQDFLVMAGLVLLKAMGAEDEADVLITLETAVALVVLAGNLGKWVMPRVVERYREEEETLLLIVLAVLFLFIGIADLGGVPLVVGAFLAGLTLSSFPSRAVVMGLLSSLADFFMVIFFVSLGALVTLPDVRGMLEVLVLILLVLVLTSVLVAWVAERAGMTSRGALEAGIYLAQTSEFSLIIGLLGLEQGVITAEIFGTLVLVTVITMTLTPFLSSRSAVSWMMSYHPSPGPKSGPAKRKAPVVIIGAGVAGSLLVEKARASNIQVVVIEKDSMVVRNLRENVCDAIWGDAGDEQTLIEAGVPEARAVVITTGRNHHYQVARRLAPKSASFWVHSFDRASLQGMDEDVRTVIYSDAAADSFMAWYREEMGSST